MNKIIDFQKVIPERQFNGSRLEMARVYRNIGAKELAENIGVNRQTISMYENNKLTGKCNSLLIF
ncbi:MAG: helix-turn-helix domain-containing protein [Lachnospiraceae bacterium]|nr:helix-turn-helix domain-containing protein [Lachnospiraceae bacterium]